MIATHKLGTILLMLALFVTPVIGVPVTQPVTDITANQATFNANGGAGIGWFEWGTKSGGYYYWSTINQTVAGAYSDTQFGTPLLTSQTYYVRACDETGCGAEVSFTTSAANVVNKTNFGGGVITMMKSGVNISQTGQAIVKPYTAQLTAPITWGLLFLFIFAGMWMRPKDIFLPCIMAMVFGGMLWMTGGLGIDPIMADIGQGLLYAAIAGIVFSWFTR